MENKVKISVVVMVYRNFSLLKETIDSILSQNYKDFELIVSDDGSPDYDPKYFDEEKNKVEDKIPYITFVHNKENVGTVKHFNNIIANAKGDIICPLSCGDLFYDENTLGDIVKMFENNKYEVVSAKRYEMLKDGKGRCKPFEEEIALLKYPKKALSHALTFGNFIGGATTYYKKSIFEKYGKFDEQYRLMEDYPEFIKLLNHDVEFGFMHKPTIKYDMTGVSTGKPNPLLVKDYILLFKNIIEQKDIKLTFFNKRALHFRIDRLTQKYNNVVLYLKYIDVVCLLGFYETFIRRFYK